jgi:hypothetical protein
MFESTSTKSDASVPIHGTLQCTNMISFTPLSFPAILPPRRQQLKLLRTLVLAQVSKTSLTLSYFCILFHIYVNCFPSLYTWLRVRRKAHQQHKQACLFLSFRLV